ncbi:hypothetical protein L596_022902 [Steinernema carpocapsae]|uniref:Cysteine dioxygenase n=1 Tax=Steinernema carpocapsae TaxID=34508 RepID=A0A4U5MBX3_STECR|nr:hypothetical protein L596_022902 [Steinernema carpocapsae]
MRHVRHIQRENSPKEEETSLVGLAGRITKKRAEFRRIFLPMETLLSRLQEIFRDDHVNTESVRAALQIYKSDPEDWRKYARFDPYKYTRNLVDEGNGKYNLLVVCWGPGMITQIHDHTNSHCFVKVLKGEIAETLFEWPADDKEAPLLPRRQKKYGLDEVTYISDKIGLHRMQNPNMVSECVTLHLYSPPYDQCQVFDEKNGRKANKCITFFTKYGVKVDYRGIKEGRPPSPEDCD